LDSQICFCGAKDIFTTCWILVQVTGYQYYKNVCVTIK